ncbi:MAG: hypothetical protein J1F40_09145 [Prevotellaceae bacterium]|nr:hypothetical protein [Prevotellaceae bacterium]
MEPFMMMLGYGLVNSMAQLVVRPIADKLSQNGRREDMIMQMEAKHKLDLESVRLNKEIELENNLNIQRFCHQCRIDEAQSQFANQLKMWQMGQFNEKMWPLLTPFDHPSLKPQYTNGQQIPINVFLAKTDPRSAFGQLLQADVKNRLSNFLQTTYSNSIDHPCVCRIGDWKDGFQDAAFINALWYGLQGQPCIVINPIQSEFGEQLDLNVSLWGLASTGYTPLTQTVITGPFGSAIGRIEREETMRWRNNDLPISSPEMKHNMELLKQEENLRAMGKGDDIIEYLQSQYKLPKEIQNEVITKFSREYSHSIACITGMYADIYHLIEYGAEPFMPQAINAYNANTQSRFQIPDITVSHYRKALTDLTCSNYLQDKLPFAYLKVAKAINFDKTSAHEVFQEGIGLWANRKLGLGQELSLPESLDRCISLLNDKSSDMDRQYLAMAKTVLISMGEVDAANEIKIGTITPPPRPNEDMEWQVSDYEQYRIDDFHSWVDSNTYRAMQLGATEAIVYIRPSKIIVIAFTDDNGKVIYDKGLGGLCVRTDAFYVSQSIIDDNLIEWSLKEQRYITNKIAFMQKKEFNSFERLGKQLDALVNNVRKATNFRSRQPEGSTQTQTATQNDVINQIANFFMETNSVSIESESVEIVEFDKVRAWVVSKLPVNNATKAHIVCTKRGMDYLVCIFFSDEENNGFLGDNYPKKRILCGQCDSEMRAFLNGGEIGTIKL